MAETSGDPVAPPGNNGTVKIDARPFDTAPNNEPHVGCSFQVDFAGFDRGNLSATYVLELWPPTGSGVLLRGSVPIGKDGAGGATDADAAVTVDPSGALARSGAEPHPIQGFHVRLTVHAQGSQGSDVKHKVFWVRTCARPTRHGPPVRKVTPPRPLAFTGADTRRPLAALVILALLGLTLLMLAGRLDRVPLDPSA